ncbi:hypothetical protein FP2506_18574 [Fulvimarina pelagi HTCC2506]|uniref:Uncharacterized protein n=1 Tax=Fulvimarina pelagi HTCC2506 TaxID=314231 RepID=Q0G0R8_9HYPH|nr:hypothetical protein FP2506_18574 [Fulvimarina pelagi HTCC2506]
MKSAKGLEAPLALNRLLVLIRVAYSAFNAPATVLRVGLAGILKTINARLCFKIAKLS